MTWEMAEKGSLAASAGLLFGCAAIGFKWVSTPYLNGYVFTAGGFFLLSRLAARFR